MNQTQAFREKFPGVEFKDEVMFHTTSWIFSAYQDEKKVLCCLEDALSRSGIGWGCKCIIVKHGDHYWDCEKCLSTDMAAGMLFDLSLSRYITKISVEYNIDGSYTLWIKVKELSGGLSTNISPEFVDRVSSLLAAKGGA